MNNREMRLINLLADGPARCVQLNIYWLTLMGVGLPTTKPITVWVLDFNEKNGEHLRGRELVCL